MKNSLKIEEAAMFGLSIYLFTLTDYAWWVYPALVLTPDIGMLGYVAGNRTGAITYNLIHHKAVAVLVLLGGWIMGIAWLELTGIVLFGHSSMDRVFGYGLKYPDHFKHTHLGWIGHEANRETINQNTQPE